MHKAITKEMIARAFKKTGLYPVNCNVFMPKDFALSKASFTTAHVPDSFPHMLSSDPFDPSCHRAACKRAREPLGLEDECV